jgi:hypothetical protein
VLTLLIFVFYLWEKREHTAYNCVSLNFAADVRRVIKIGNRTVNCVSLNFAADVRRVIKIGNRTVSCVDTVIVYDKKMQL